ncbi:hypothetical protein K493DRAFT_304285 [Basidiobolus meristosporus CBS 931.73]|uniref:Arrestin-like N-terminal domain-containing protein n=1 Tax=Basidiobolus meristosporus CBS 931.73 TaxID=1314790 RepID=A0A1Y1XZG6_9FUNG|nr:hypothetical protein K493DRAFT_304285 [Basidiobolus meristosporus CBS 931.73]|eukprot:ORX91153.1 hypothetical protein K493DRAFT_304285 [Basidiobolus meristosporus CBS 931.73]
MNMIRHTKPCLQLRTLSNTVLVHEDCPESYLHVTVDLKLHRPLKVRSIYLTLKGVFTRKRLGGLWEEKSTKHTSYHHILERQGTEYYLGPGDYSYECVVKIPNQSEQTAVTHLGKVDYQLYGVVETMKFHSNLTNSVPVYIRRVLPACEEFRIADGLWRDMLRYQVMLNGVDYSLKDSLNVAFRLESLVGALFSWKLTATLNESVAYFKRSQNGRSELKKCNRIISKVVRYKSGEAPIQLAILNLPIVAKRVAPTYDCHGKYVSVSHHIKAKIEMADDKRYKFISVLPVRLIHPDIQQWLEKYDSTNLPRYSSLLISSRATSLALPTNKCHTLA